jgi:hypothetical protein
LTRTSFPTLVNQPDNAVPLHWRELVQRPVRSGTNPTNGRMELSIMAKEQTTKASTDIEVSAKPLTATQLRNLQQLVDLDFNDLRERLNNDLTQQQSRRLSALNEALHTDVERIAEVNTLMQDEITRTRDALNARLGAIAKKHGMQWNTAFPCKVELQPSATFMTPEKSAAVTAKNKLADAFFRVLNEVLTTVNREHRKVTRMVLLQGISAQGAAEIINDLPNPDDILSIVQSSAALTHEDDIKTILGENKSLKELASD